jgi:hypothetical protein
MYGWARLAAAVAVAVTFCASGTPPAFAATDSTTLSRDQIEAGRQDLLRLMLQDPSNLDVAFEYASLASQVGDYEAAVSTLERMLIFAPNTPRLQLELGILYYRLGSYEVSRSYFAQVVANPNVPPEIAAKVRLYLQQLAIEAEPPPFSATIFSGIRWESNANSAPASQAVTLNGINFTLDTQSVAAPDWSAVNIGTMHYGYDLKNQGDRIEFDAITYNANYFDLTDINLNFFEATLGPSFNMKRIGWDKTRFYVYGIGDEVLLRNDQYFAAGGGGVRLLSFAAERSVLNLRLETRVASSPTAAIARPTPCATAPKPALAAPTPITSRQGSCSSSRATVSAKTPRWASTPTGKSEAPPVSPGPSPIRLPRPAVILGLCRSGPAALTAVTTIPIPPSARPSLKPIAPSGAARR